MCKLVLDHIPIHAQLFMQDRPGHRPEAVAGHLGLGVVAHAAQGSIHGGIAHGLLGVTSGKDMLPSPGERLQLAQQGHGGVAVQIDQAGHQDVFAQHRDFPGGVALAGLFGGEQFQDAYRPTAGMSFGLAFEALKKGHKVARLGWNGKGMWLSLSCNPGNDAANGKREIAAENFWSNNNYEYARSIGGSAVVLPCVTMKTATGEILMGWLASQSDMFADDYYIVE